MELTNKVSQRPDLVAADMGDETVMMDVLSGKYFKLSSVGGDIWNLIEEPVTVEELINKLTSEYDVDRETCQTQTLDFLDECLNFFTYRKYLLRVLKSSPAHL